MMPGMIMLWAGSAETIPAGWVLCDGNNDTPDLRNKFIVGAGDTYNPGDTGGAASHIHTAQAPEHTHSLTGGAVIGSGSGYYPTVTGGSVPITVDSASNLPPYYALCFIMKV
jgi:microcystin-dependent protein